MVDKLGARIFRNRLVHQSQGFNERALPDPGCPQKKNQLPLEDIERVNLKHRFARTRILTLQITDSE